mmetsp:Transcript_20681/g.57142  ORF Transcript_20681/g.57142 Transcript_20681/m.57142 type:complete len:209 (-) Transcript_20681:493-1119(-)
MLAPLPRPAARGWRLGGEGLRDLWPMVEGTKGTRWCPSVAGPRRGDHSHRRVPCGAGVPQPRVGGGPGGPGGERRVVRVASRGLFRRRYHHLRTARGCGGLRRRGGLAQGRLFALGLCLQITGVPRGAGAARGHGRSSLAAAPLLRRNSRAAAAVGGRLPLGRLRLHRRERVAQRNAGHQGHRDGLQQRVRDLAGYAELGSGAVLQLR